jgi:hypothetical protein
VKVQKQKVFSTKCKDALKFFSTEFEIWRAKRWQHEVVRNLEILENVWRLAIKQNPITLQLALSEISIFKS